jgi:hypothetical protein
VTSPVEMAIHDKPGPGIREVGPKLRHAFAHHRVDVEMIPPARSVVELVAAELQRRAPSMEAGAVVAKVEPRDVLLEPLEQRRSGGGG